MDNNTRSFGNLAIAETTPADPAPTDLASMQAMLRKILEQTAPEAKAAVKSTLPRVELLRLFAGWQRDCVISQHSKRTIDSHERTFNLLLWYLDHNDLKNCGTEELRSFFAYASTPALALVDQDGEQIGRWGVSARERPCAVKAPKPLTILTYFGQLRSFFNWIVAQGELTASPLAPIKLPRNQKDQIQPFTTEQKRALYAW